MSAADRARYVEAIRADLMGPLFGDEERLTLPAASTPLDLYVTGILYPAVEDALRAEVLAEQDDEGASAPDSAESPGEPTPGRMVHRPQTMGLSFTIQSREAPALELVLRGATYVRESQLNHQSVWRRAPLLERCAVAVTLGYSEHVIGDGLVASLRVLQQPDDATRWLVTAALTNKRRARRDERGARVPLAEQAIFQAQLTVEATRGVVVPRRARALSARLEHDRRVNELLYRDTRELAVGHICAADWTEQPGEAVSQIRTEWLPTHTVRAMDPAGAPVFEEVARASGLALSAVLDAGVLGAASPEALGVQLGVIPAAYERWLDAQAAQAAALHAAGALEAEQLVSAEDNVEAARGVVARMRAGIGRLVSDEVAREAFQLAQRAMVQQARWREGREDSTLRWRPFQLGFQLLVLDGLASGADEVAHPDIEVMDLLWFPTGGGKTEAYLALTAFTLFHRRLRQDKPDDGVGVAVIMRYTLRLLTVQQFERAARLVMACELARRGAPSRLGATPFSIGLWVGMSSTPNKVEEARRPDAAAKARQLSRCPVCGEDSLQWDPHHERPKAPYVVVCQNPDCAVHSAHGPLPIYTIDELIYAQCPSLLIATVDKFAQAARNKDSTRLFGAAEVQPPELIIQDELHLIAGPLGSMVGLYEAAFDRIFTRADGRRAKIIGSTATIRRAAAQVGALFDRGLCQFPPPILSATDSCFAVEDTARPGRMYIGLSSAGHTPKVAANALFAAQLQRAVEDEIVCAEARDPYWTLVAYFNSLRDLGGALISVYDEVGAGIQALAALHEREPRGGLEHLELSSRMSAAEIPTRLKELEAAYPEQIYSVVMATNMLSVGVDIPRLGLMTVLGQPKSMAEYIQATSRVGRGDVAGLVFTVFSAARPRDRSAYESFKTWHQRLYAAVEASSVTPFAPRARDKALHTCLVLLARHLLPRTDPERFGVLREQPALSASAREVLVAELEHIAARAARQEQADEAAREQLRQDVLHEGHEFLDAWAARAPKHYWSDREPGLSLLISAEHPAASSLERGDEESPPHVKPTLNSMRDVEPSVPCKLYMPSQPF